MKSTTSRSRPVNGNRDELKILLQICLIASQINQELRRNKGVHWFLKENFRPILGPFDPVDRCI